MEDKGYLFCKNGLKMLRGLDIGTESTRIKLSLVDPRGLVYSSLNSFVKPLHDSLVLKAFRALHAG